MKIVLAILLFTSPVIAAQSITFNGSSQYTTRTITNASPFTSVGAWRLEARLTNIGSGGPYRVVDNDHYYVQLNTTTGQLTIFSWDSEITDTTLVLNGFATHTSDIVIRVQKDTANNRYTAEAWDSNSQTRFASGSGAATMSNRNYGGDIFYIGAQSIGQNGSEGKWFDGRVAFVRWWAGTDDIVDIATGVKPTLYADAGDVPDLLQYEFESNLNDSSGNSQTLTGVGSPTYNTTPTINPIASAGADVGGRVAGVTYSLSATGSVAGDVGPITGYTWTRTSGSGSITSPNSATTDITGSSAGQSTFQVEITDGTNTNTDTVDVGVINTNADGTVNTGSTAIDIIVGPLVPYNSTASQVLPFYDANQEASFATHQAVADIGPRDQLHNSGTVAVTNGSTAVVGTGTRFTKEVTTTEPLYIKDGANPYLTYVTFTITDDTHITLGSNWTGATASGVSNWNQSENNEVDDYSGHAHYYDSALSAYIAYLRTGLTKWRTEALRLADAWWTSNNISYGEIDPTDTGLASAPRGVALSGLMLAAIIDGRTQYWDWIDRYVGSTGGAMDIWVLQRVDYPGLYFGLRDPGYSLLYAVQLSQVLPNTYPLYGNGTLAASTGTETGGATKRSTYFTNSMNALMNYHARLQRPDGSWRWSDDWDFDTVVEPSTDDGYAEQSFHVGVGLIAAMEAMLTITEGNGSYQAEYNTLRQALMASAAEVMLMGYSTTDVTDTPAIDSRFVFYESFSQFRWGSSGMPDTLPGWATIADIRDARQNIVTFAHALGAAYHYTGTQWFKDQNDEVLSANWGKTGYSGTIGLSDGYWALQDATNHQLKEYNEWHRYIGRAFAWRFVTASTITAPFVTAGRDRVFANGTSNPQFTARAINPSGGSLTYQWTAGVGTPTLSGATTATATVTSALADNTFYSLKVCVTNAAGKTTCDWVNYRTSGTAENTPPVANVANQNVMLSLGATSSATALDASTSTAFGGRSLRYRWYQTSGAASTISNPKIANPNLTGLGPGTYTYRVFVYDNLTRLVEETGTDAVDVRVEVPAVRKCNWHTNPACAG